MNNVDFLKKLNADRKNEVLAALNRQQLAMGNSVMNWDYFNNLRRDEQHTLLENNAYFGTLYAFIYTKMLEVAEKYKSAESKKYAKDYINSYFFGGSIQKIYNLTETSKTNIRKRIDACWSK